MTGLRARQKAVRHQRILDVALHLFREEEVAKLLGIPEGVGQVGLLPVAWTQGTEFKPAVRPPPESITSWNGWQS